jgi:hypothetical protein
MVTDQSSAKALPHHLARAKEMVKDRWCNQLQCVRNIKSGSKDVLQDGKFTCNELKACDMRLRKIPASQFADALRAFHRLEVLDLLCKPLLHWMIIDKDSEAGMSRSGRYGTIVLQLIAVET